MCCEKECRHTSHMYQIILQTNSLAAVHFGGTVCSRVSKNGMPKNGQGLCSKPKIRTTFGWTQRNPVLHDSTILYRISRQ